VVPALHTCATKSFLAFHWRAEDLAAFVFLFWLVGATREALEDLRGESEEHIDKVCDPSQQASSDMLNRIAYEQRRQSTRYYISVELAEAMELADSLARMLGVEIAARSPRSG
jgi:hypothetical protein